MSAGGKRYTVEFSPGARRSVATMPEKAATALIELAFGGLADNPHRLGKPLTRELEGYHSVRRGDFRIICRIDDDQQKIFVVRVAHRSDIYRPR